jgi:hypothetical protein
MIPNFSVDKTCAQSEQAISILPARREAKWGFTANAVNQRMLCALRCGCHLRRPEPRLIFWLVR